MLLLKLKISSKSRNFASHQKKNWTDEKYQILKNNIKTYVDINLSNSWSLILHNLIEFIRLTSD